MDIINQIRTKLKGTSHIIGRDQYIDTAVLIPLIFLENQWQLLFQERAKTIPQGGEVCFPGGRVDSVDQDREATAIRETIEELGVTADKIKVLGYLGTLVNTMGVCLESYVGVLDVKDLNTLNLSKEEVEKVFTIPLSYFMDHKPDTYHIKLEAKPYNEIGDEKEILLPVKALNLPERYHKPWTGRLKKVYVYETAHGVIWGMTGELIYEFINRVKN